MKKLPFKMLVLICAAVFIYSCSETLTVENDVDDLVNLKSASTEKQSYIVVLNDAELNAELDKVKGFEKKQEKVKATYAKILKRAKVSDDEMGHVYGTVFQGFSLKIPPGQLKKLQNDPSVKFVEEDYTISLDPIVATSTVSATSTQSIPWGITRVNGGTTYTGSNVAWIVDSGIDLDHPDLNVNTTLSKDFTGSGSADDSNGHGTHVAGTVAALDNGIGVIGVAAGAPVVSCRVLGSDGTGDFSWTVAALDYILAVGTPGDVINMSLGPRSRFTHAATDQAVLAVANANFKLALSAGNEGDDASYYSPARVNHENVYTVAAMAEGDVWASYSNYGSPVDCIEPGSSVRSTYKNGQYATLSGTSMASPHMAGILLSGSFDPDGEVSVRKRGTWYRYPILVLNGGTPPPPTNQSPTAEFSFSATDLTVAFTDESTDNDGTIDSWQWNFGDGVSSSLQNPSHTFASSGSYTVSLTVTDDDGAADTYSTSVSVSDQEPPAGDIVLTATGRKVRGTKNVDLSWTGSNSVELFVNGAYNRTVSGNSTSLSLGKGGGTYVFKVCASDGSGCSNEETVVF